MRWLDQNSIAWKRVRVFTQRSFRLHGLRSFVIATVVISIVFSLLAITIPTQRINIIVWVSATLIISTLLSHLVAGSVSTSSRWWTAFWRWVDYLWVLAAFGTLLIATAKSDLDRAAQLTIESEIQLAQTGSRLDERCDETLEMIVSTSQAGSIANATLRDCIALKIPALEHRFLEKMKLDYTLAMLENEKSREGAAVQISALLTIPVFLRPVEERLFAEKESTCASIIQRYKLPKPLILSGLNEGLTQMVHKDFLGQLYEQPKDGTTYWRPNPRVLALTQNFKNDVIIFCARTEMLLSSNRHLENKQRQWGVIGFLVNNVQAWYLAFAVFAGLRLGRSAFDSRPRA